MCSGETVASGESDDSDNSNEVMMIIMIRPGWLTIGPDLSNSNYDWSSHQGYFKEGVTTGCTER